MITRFVDCDAEAGGNGTTNALTGANCAYKSLNIWEAARQAVLTDIEECICESNGAAHTADTMAVTIDGWTTTAAYYIYIHTSAAGRHDGKWNTGKYRIQSVDTIVNMKEENVRVDGLQVYMTSITATGKSGIQTYAAVGVLDIRVSNNIIRGITHDTFNHFGIVNFYNTDSAGSVVRYWNNIIYGFLGAAGWGIQANNNDLNTTAYIYNNTLQNNGYGIQVFQTTSIAKNNIVKGSGNVNTYVGTFAVGTDYNATDGTDNIGQGSNNRISQTFTFVDEAGDDFHLASNDAGARNYGVDLSADSYIPFSTDIDGQTRPTGAWTWDIGADEYVSVSAIKTINGLARASVKTINGLAIASMKTWNGLA